MSRSHIARPNLSQGAPSSSFNALSTQQFQQSRHTRLDEARKLNMSDAALAKVKPFIPLAAHKGQANKDDVRNNLGIRRLRYDVRTGVDNNGNITWDAGDVYEQKFNGAQNKLVGTYIEEVPSHAVIEILKYKAERARELAEIEQIFLDGGDELIQLVSPKMYAILANRGTAGNARFKTDSITNAAGSGPIALPSRIPFYSPTSEDYGDALNKFRYFISVFYNDFFFDDMGAIRKAAAEFRKAKGLGYSGLPEVTTSVDNRHISVSDVPADGNVLVGGALADGVANAD
jgi:hypothetical protein